MASKKNETALAVADNFKIANRYEGMDPELMAELQDQMEDLDPESGINCRLIKIPAGGKLAYEVQGDEDDDVDYKKEIDGVIIFTHRVNGFWPNAFGTSGNPEDKIPACSSMDGKTGLWLDTGELRTCESCPMNQFGSATSQKGEQAKGKACKNMRRLYLMLDGDPNFYLLTVPPTSIRDVNRQLQKILGGGVPYTGLIVKFTLEKAKNAGGIEYSKVVISKAGPLPPAVAAQAVAMRRQIKNQYQNMTLTLDDYAPAQEAPRSRNGGVDVSADDFDDGADPAQGATFEEAPPHTDEDLPFA